MITSEWFCVWVIDGFALLALFLLSGRPAPLVVTSQLINLSIRYLHLMKVFKKGGFTVMYFWGRRNKRIFAPTSQTARRKTKETGRRKHSHTFSLFSVYKKKDGGKKVCLFLSRLGRFGAKGSMKKGEKFVCVAKRKGKKFQLTCLLFFFCCCRTGENDFFFLFRGNAQMLRGQKGGK